MKKEKTKQIILIVVAFMFLGVGLFNFHYQQNTMEVAARDMRNELSLGDVQLVNSDPTNENINKKLNETLGKNIVESEGNNYLSEIVSNEELENFDKKNLVENNNEISEVASLPENMAQNQEQYFVETKLQRDTMYSQMLETYQKMLENPDVGETQKAIAAQEITNINNIKNGVMISENLIKNKGFENVVILVNNGVVSVVVKSPLLTQEQIAKIQNIVSRELNVELKNIHISKK